ncbi:MAG: putative ABC transporter permease [Treponema sp.]|nr:putative ABC transporter permease [Treponema sp.]
MDLPEKFIKLEDYLFVAMMIAVFGAVGGFIYETFFYRLAWGYFVKRGTTFGPWIPIYGVGAIFMTFSVWRFRKNPLAIFLISFFVTGILEFIVGFVLFHCFNVRLWDYYNEPWNFGNIGGYVCLRSVGIFGIFGFLLFYGVIPGIIIIQQHLPKKVFRVISSLLLLIFIADIVVHMIVHGLNHGI